MGVNDARYPGDRPVNMGTVEAPVLYVPEPRANPSRSSLIYGNRPEVVSREYVTAGLCGAAENGQ